MIIRELTDLGGNNLRITGHVRLRFSSTRLYMSLKVHGTGLLSKEESGSANEFVWDSASKRGAKMVRVHNNLRKRMFLKNLVSFVSGTSLQSELGLYSVITSDGARWA